MIKYILNQILFLWSQTISLFFQLLNTKSEIKNANKKDILISKLQHCQTFEEWSEVARQLDIILESDNWRKEPSSPFYDYRFISARLRYLRNARESFDTATMIYRLRPGLLRNLGGILDERLYSSSLIGTKILIEDYTKECVAQLEYLADCEFLLTNTEQTKYEFFSDIRQAFGSTCLLLDGGAGFGVFHLGVVKCLFECDLLPRILCGRGVGAVVAALVCIYRENEFSYKVFDPSAINVDSFQKKDKRGIFYRRLMRFLKYGYLMDVTVIDRFVADNLGDITFEEAYKYSNRTLNIVVTSTRKNQIPKLMNYLTAPNVLIRTAACASMAVAGLYDKVQLLAKDKSGKIIDYIGPDIRWTDSSTDSKAEPIERLAELFNVNHIILSQANPYFVYFMKTSPIPQPDGMLKLLGRLIRGELLHRLFQLDGLALLPGSIKVFLMDQNIGHVQIYPSVYLKDYWNSLLSVPSAESISYWIHRGEEATWPLISNLTIRCAIEFTMDKIILKLKQNRVSTADAKISLTKKRLNSTPN